MPTLRYRDAVKNAVARNTSYQYVAERFSEEHRSVCVGSNYSIYGLATYPGYYKVAREPVFREGSTHAPWIELLKEWPELGCVAAKLFSGEELDERDKEWVREVAEATGWDPDDVADELKSIGGDCPRELGGTGSSTRSI